MKQITYDEYLRRYTVPQESEIPDHEDEQEGWTFYDNGAVSNPVGDFIVKAEEAQKRRL